MTLYCGNNVYELLKGKRLGSPYDCLKQGVGVGLHSSLAGFNPNYAPIIPSNIYCGKDDYPPLGKVFGTPTECLRKGVGIGKRLQYDRTHGYGAVSVPSPRPLPTPQPTPQPTPLPVHPPQITVEMDWDNESDKMWLYLIILGVAALMAVLFRRWWLLLLGIIIVVVAYVYF
jgi:hypothetical protein